jgi:hypothetical protein
MPISHADATTSAVIAVVPQTITVGDNIPTEPFTVNVTITGVTGMFCWQAKIYYDTTILNCTKAEFPTNHVFAGKTFYPAGPVIEQNYTFIGATVFNEADVFSGDGILCQITFVGKAVGSSTLQFDVEETYCTDYNLTKIDATTENGNVNVVPEFPPSLIIPLFILATLAAAVLVKTAGFKRRLDSCIIKR